MNRSYLSEAFQNLGTLNEEDFTLTNGESGLEDMKSFLDSDEKEEFVDIIDPEAETEEEIEDTYMGKVILDCCVCHSKIYKSANEVTVNEDEECANVGEECPYCYSSDGFKIVGQVAPYQPESELKVEVEDKPEEELPAEEVPTEDTPIEEPKEDKVNESLKEEFIEDESGSNGYWDFAKDLASELMNKGVIGDDSEEAQEVIYNILKYDLNDEVKRIANLKCDANGCIEVEDTVDESLNEEKTPVMSKEEIIYHALKEYEENHYASEDSKWQDRINDLLNTYNIKSQPRLEESLNEWLGLFGTPEPSPEEKKRIHQDNSNILDTYYEMLQKAYDVASPQNKLKIDNIITSIYGNDTTIKNLTAQQTPDILKVMIQNGPHFKFEDGEAVEESLNEGFEKVELETEDKVIKVSEEPKEVIPDAEMVAPVTPEIKDEIKVEEPEEEEAPIEDIPNEQDVDFEDFDEDSFNELGEGYLKKVYENVDSFKTTSASVNENNLKLEGVIKFASGKEKKTTFMFEAKDMTSSGLMRFVGENTQISRGKKSFTLTGRINENKFMNESLNYNYRAKTPDGKSTRLYGTIKASNK